MKKGISEQAVENIISRTNLN